MLARVFIYRYEKTTHWCVTEWNKKTLHSLWLRCCHTTSFQNVFTAALHRFSKWDWSPTGGIDAILPLFLAWCFDDSGAESCLTCQASVHIVLWCVHLSVKAAQQQKSGRKTQRGHTKCSCVHGARRGEGVLIWGWTFSSSVCDWCKDSPGVYSWYNDTGTHSQATRL